MPADRRDGETENPRHTPVVARGMLAGVISVGDVMKPRIADIGREANSIRENVTMSERRPRHAPAWKYRSAIGAVEMQRPVQLAGPRRHSRDIIQLTMEML